ncbi:hypothetical protein FBEOM_11326 [Fusarium beomiforme]|uniref:Uncharacterized protein n=1 Tax=Fusarium beomiforme TaxID=44412 RepID=A0A9P5DRU3_9HYPO|nr:hypothetical protein FBEOM_11326 [Fusarium beomiforme]
MAFYFQPPIFGNYILPIIPRNVLTTLFVPYEIKIVPLYSQSLQLVPLYGPSFTSSIRIKVIYHRAGTVLASNDAYYNYLPTRDTVRENLSWWSDQHNLGDKAYDRQCTLYLTRSSRSVLTIDPRDGPILPLDLVKKVSFGEMMALEFQTMMTETAMNNYGAFILVDHAYVPVELLAQQNDNDQSTPTNGPLNNSTDSTQIDPTNNTQPTAAASARQPSPPPRSPMEPTNTDAPEPTTTGNNATSPEPIAPEATDLAAAKSDVAPAESYSEPEPKPPKVASVESDNEEEEGVASG